MVRCSVAGSSQGVKSESVAPGIPVSAVLLLFSHTPNRHTSTLPVTVALMYMYTVQGVTTPRGVQWSIVEPLYIMDNLNSIKDTIGT